MAGLEKLEFMEHHSVKISGEAKVGHLQLFLLGQLTAIDACPDCEFESRFNIFVIAFEEIFRNHEKNSEDYGFDEDKADRTMYAELIDIFHHALVRISAQDIYFARKIIFLLSHRLPRKSVSGSAYTFVDPP
jgi:hypothetical protein